MDFQAEKQKLLSSHPGPRVGLEFARGFAALVDRFVTRLFADGMAASGLDRGVALVALGGYGRGGLSPYSDIDLLFLADRPDDPSVVSVVERVLYTLWDLKLDVGHAVRTPQQGLDMAKSDFATLSTQLDGRLVAGDGELFEAFQKKIRHYLGPLSRKQDFFKNLKQSIALRHEKQMESPYLLEPNVKEGQGALRDIHAVGWSGSGLYHVASLHDLVTRTLLSAEQAIELEDARAFLLDVRHNLHLAADEKTDTLTFELQEEVARRLGVAGNGHITAVERFMRDYYTHAYRTKNTLEYFLSQVEQDLIPRKTWRMTSRGRRVEKGLSILRGRIELGSRSEVRSRPSLMMRAFEVSATSGLPISSRSLELIRTNLDLIDDDFRAEPKIAAWFLSGLSALPPRQRWDPAHAEALRLLYFMEAYLPELAGVSAQVQHDAYHVYTVDVHSVVTVIELKKIALGLDDGNDFGRSVFESVEDREVLFLAALIHDAGKGHGQDHAKSGAELASGIGRRLGLNDRQNEDLAFLVANHLFLPEIATRRDLTEEKLIVTSARRIGDLQRLHMLYLLTEADSKATGPGVWTDWKAMLVRDLYSKIHRVLTKSDLARKETSDRVDQLLLEVVGRLEGEIPQDALDRSVEKMSAHYLSVMTADEVVRHVRLEREMDQKKLIWETELKAEGHYEVVVLCADRPGLLSRLAGLFTLHNINILGAQVFTRANNVALDIFQVEPPPDRVFADEAFERVRQDASRVLDGRLALDYRLSKKRAPLRARGPVTRMPDDVKVDNDTSDFHTIVEIYTYDRLGLLYDVTRTLFDLQLSINIAKISTKVEQVVDVFYVRDLYGQKLTDPDQLRELDEALRFTLAR